MVRLVEYAAVGPLTALPRALTPAERLRSAHKSTNGLDFKPMCTMDAGARCARGLETRGNDGYGGAVTPEVRERTSLRS